MIKKITTLIIVFSSIGAVSAQTSGRIDQFYLDPSVVNPAAMNMQQQGSVGLYYNKMYSAIPGSGQSTLLNVILPVPDKRTGFGFLYMREKVGFQQLHNAYFTYAYTLPLGDATNLHLGVSLGVLSQNFDANKAVYISQNDPVVRALLYSPSSTRADVRGSAMLQAGNFAGGIGFSRLVRPRFDYSYYNYKASFSLQNLTNLVLQYNIEFSDNFALKPSVQIMAYNADYARFQGNVSAWYKKKAWLGATIMSQKQFGFNLGFQLQDAVKCGYAVSLAMGNVNGILGPVHEFTTTIALGALKSGESASSSKPDIVDIDQPAEVKPTTGARRYEEVTVKRLSDLENAGLGLDTAGLKIQPIEKTKTTEGYYLVAGIHSTEAKADQMIKKLYMQDVVAFKFFDIVNNSYYVYMKTFKTEKEATRYIQYYEMNLPQAWIRQVK